MDYLEICTRCEMETEHNNGKCMRCGHVVKGFIYEFEVEQLVNELARRGYSLKINTN